MPMAPVHLAKMESRHFLWAVYWHTVHIGGREGGREEGGRERGRFLLEYKNSLE